MFVSITFRSRYSRILSYNGFLKAISTLNLITQQIRILAGTAQYCQARTHLRIPLLVCSTWKLLYILLLAVFFHILLLAVFLATHFGRWFIYRCLKESRNSRKEKCSDLNASFRKQCGYSINLRKWWKNLKLETGDYEQSEDAACETEGPPLSADAAVCSPSDSLSDSDGFAGRAGAGALKSNAATQSSGLSLSNT